MSEKHAVETREAHIKSLEKSLTVGKMTKDEKTPIEDLIKTLKAEVKELKGK